MSIKYKFFSLGILLSLLLSGLQVSPAAALSITSVNPAIVTTGFETEVTITGDDFEVNSVAVRLMPGAINLPIKSWSTTSLVVTVPANTPVRDDYSVEVANNPGLAGETIETFSPFKVVAGPPPTATPQPTATSAPFGRPQLVVNSYRTNVGEIKFNEEFNLVVRLHNAGQVRASNIQAVFSSPDLTPTKTGGVSAHRRQAKNWTKSR